VANKEFRLQLRLDLALVSEAVNQIVVKCNLFKQEICLKHSKKILNSCLVLQSQAVSTVFGDECATHNSMLCG
jgi:hypothetical protein